MDFHAILWDLDGVIVDSGELHYESWRQICPDYGIPFSREMFIKIFGMNNQLGVSTLLGKPAPDELWREVSERKEALFRELLRGNVVVLPGVLHWLEMAHQSGIKQAVASSAPSANIEITLNEGHIIQFFEAVISAYGKPGKPDPWVFLEAATRLGVDAGDCLVIEDSLMGITAARRAGAACLAVATTNRIEALKSSEADWVFESLPTSFPWRS